MTRTSNLVALYVLFASIAILANLISQAISVSVYSGLYAIEISILIGTAFGLFIKYALDKQYIFQYRTNSLLHDGKPLFLYTAMGILTTLLFWVVEYAFYFALGTETMRYAGGFIGLVIGYICKYRLDKRFVFVKEVYAQREL